MTEDLFGPRAKTPRGWTELDKVRSRIGRLERKIAAGEAHVREMEELSHLRDVLVSREREATEKWKKSCGK